MPGGRGSFTVDASGRMSAAPTWGNARALCRCPLCRHESRKTVLIPGEAGSVPRYGKMSKIMDVTADEVTAASFAVRTG